MKNKIQIILMFFLIAAISIFACLGINNTLDSTFESKLNTEPRFYTESGTYCETIIPASIPDAEFITGPLAAEVGELCIFRLNDSKTRADWTVIRQIDKEAPTTFYIDSSGSALTFSSNIAAKYTIVAAIIEGGTPKILQHVCQYGTAPSPTPGPNPEPTPQPNPQPEPVTLTDWVRQNIPEAGKSQAAVLASCYESAATAIEKGSIKTPEAAFSAIRTNTQTKIKIDVWKDFLDQLSEKINEKCSDNRDIKKLGEIFSEIAIGLKPVANVEMSSNTVTSPTSRPTATKLPGGLDACMADACGEAACFQPQPVRIFPGLFQGGRR